MDRGSVIDKDPMRLEWRDKSMDSLPDEQLMIRIADGDRMAYRSLVERHLGGFLAFASRLSGDRAEAEDILQEAFLRLWKNAVRWDPGRNVRFTTWFYRIVMNLSIDAHRRRKPVSDFGEADDVVCADPLPDEMASYRQMADATAQALKRLPERQRIALTLCYLQGMGNREAAQVMDVTIGAIESLLIRGRRKMALLLKGQREDFLKESI